MTKYLMPVMTALFIGCGLTANAQLVINELMLSNIDCLMDDLKEFPDSWVECITHRTRPALSTAIKWGCCPMPQRLGLCPVAPYRPTPT